MSHPVKQTSNTIMCSAGRGETTKPDCLACARARRNACHLELPVLTALFADQERVRTGIHVTDLTGCLRKAYYDKTEPVAEFPHEMLSRFIGTAVHKYIEETRSDDYDNEVPVSGFGVVGTADILYKDGRLVDFKCTRWINPERLPYGSHVQQLNAYAAILKSQGREVKSAAIQYIDLTGPSKHNGKCRGKLEPTADGFVCVRCGNPANGHPGVFIYEVELDTTQTTEWIAIREQLLRLSLESGETPEAETSWLCDYCPHVAKCNSQGA